MLKDLYNSIPATIEALNLWSCTILSRFTCQIKIVGVYVIG